MSWGLARNCRPSMWWPRSFMLNLAFESEYSALPSPATPESVSLCGPAAGGIGGGRDGGGEGQIMRRIPSRRNPTLLESHLWCLMMHDDDSTCTQDTMYYTPYWQQHYLSCRARLRESVPSKEQLTTTSLRQSFYVDLGSVGFDHSSLKTASRNGHRSTETKVTMRAKHEECQLQTFIFDDDVTQFLFGVGLLDVIAGRALCPNMSQF